jgi:hypothetical protein
MPSDKQIPEMTESEFLNHVSTALMPLARLTIPGFDNDLPAPAANREKYQVDFADIRRARDAMTMIAERLNQIRDG